jgi:oxygen-independent coproporphyrinogen-3 oxidase
MHTKTKLAELGLFDAKVPRYTSYPTAPQFGGGVDGAVFGDWVSSVPENGQISLYIHVPFCRRLCWFCACRTQGTQSDAPVAAYLETLLAEIALLGRTLPRGVTLSRMHWGGGTPTLLQPDMMQRLADAVFDILPLGPNAEFSVEIDPNEIDQARVNALVAAGMTRASIGVQDFDADIQTTIGRIQSFEITRQAADMLRDGGVTSLNADILFGLPHQDTRRITASVQKLLSLNPDRVALYGYAHVPWMARRQSLIPSDALPSPQERLDLFETARKLFVWDGYSEIGIDHFATKSDGLSVAARAGKLRRNFQGYTDDQADVLIGLGASSISRFPQGYAQNAPATSSHTKAIREGAFSTTRGHVFSEDDKLRGRVIEALMCDFEVRMDEILMHFPKAEKTLMPMLRDAASAFEGLVELTPNRLHIRRAGRPLTRIIARHFDAYDMSASGHSSAI